MFLVPYCDFRYEFRVKTMFDSSGPSFVLSGLHVLFMLFVFIYVYWCPTLFQYQMMFASFNSKSPGVPFGAGNPGTSGAPELTPCF